jgi:hypothetical protein
MNMTINKVIDVFENRIMELTAITDLTKLPQWDDIDILGAECLLEEYRRLSSAKSRAADLAVMRRCCGKHVPL